MALQITVTNKATHAATAVAGQEVTLAALSVVTVPINHARVKSLARQGNDLVITTVDGQVIVLHQFFVDGQDGHNDLVFQDDDGGGLWLTDWNELNALPAGVSVDPASMPGLIQGGAGGDAFTTIESIEPLLDAHNSSWLPVALGIAGFATALGVAASAGGGEIGRAHV
jgi:hypothetical protein